MINDCLGLKSESAPDFKPLKPAPFSFCQMTFLTLPLSLFVHSTLVLHIDQGSRDLASPFCVRRVSALTVSSVYPVLSHTPVAFERDMHLTWILNLHLTLNLNTSCHETCALMLQIRPTYSEAAYRSRAWECAYASISIRKNSC